MSESALRFPNDVAHELNVSPATLRRWSSEFADFLSDSAGRPELSSGGETAHRRYTDEDVGILQSVGELLRRGLTYREIAAQLYRSRRDPGQESEQQQGGELAVLPSRTEAGAVLSSSLSFMSNAMERVVEGQQFILSSQQANRDLLGIVIQDNFNLKEENSRLRERMQEMERDVSELRRQEQNMRAEVTQRLFEIEGKQALRDPAAGDEKAARPLGCITRLLRFLF